jgi:hypothetical protein
MVWPEDIPPEVVAEKAAQARPARRPKLRAVPETGDAEPDAGEPEPARGAVTKGAVAKAGNAKPAEGELESALEAGEASASGPPDRAAPAAAEQGDTASPEASGGKSRPPYLRVVK